VTIAEAIKTAIEFETKVRDTYIEALNRSTDQTGRRIFSTLAQEEQNHLIFLARKLTEWEKSGTVKPEELKTSIPPKRKIEKEQAKLKNTLSHQDWGVELQMLRKALAVEIETSNFYHLMVNELPYPGSKLFAPFLKIEEGHQAIVQAEIDFLTRTGFWFDFKELDLEVGL